MRQPHRGRWNRTQFVWPGCCRNGESRSRSNFGGRDDGTVSLRTQAHISCASDSCGFQGAGCHWRRGSLRLRNEVRRQPICNASQNWIAANKYVPFAIARGDWGPGTVVDFPGGSEEIVAFDQDCLTLQQNNLIRTTDVAVVSGDYTINDADSADLTLAKGFPKPVNLKGAFKDSRVRNIRVALGATRERATSITALKQRVAELAAAHMTLVSTCCLPGAMRSSVGSLWSTGCPTTSRDALVCQ
jgi:hypothetical protein